MDLVDFPVGLPAYPAGLGLPDRVYLQTLADSGSEGQVLILVWHYPEQPDEPRLSLSIIDAPFYGIKQAPVEIILETRVNGQYAYWIQGPHRLQLQNGDYTEWVFVAGNVLLWTNGEITYRLESGLPFVEARRVAESLTG